MGSAGKKWLILLALGASVVFVMVATDFGQRLSLSSIQNGAIALKAWVAAHYGLAVCLFALTYIVVNLWFPAAAVLTLLAGFLYGTVLGTVYVDAIATLGAVIAFVASRELAGAWVQDRWSEALQGFNRAVSEYGSEYLLLVRVTPLMPYFLINFLAGLTKVRLVDFAWTTALGSLPGILIFCYAGRQLLALQSVEEILTFRVVAAFAFLTAFLGSMMVVGRALKKRGD
jgi:uncharacterized membrane protein YdjX (TVP38/TMEM64 family)